MHEIRTIFRGDIDKRISGNFAVESILKFTLFSKLKTERSFHREVQNVTGPESQASLTRGTGAKWLYPTNLDANLSTLRWLSTILGAVSGNSRDGACFKLDKQIWRRKKQWYTDHDFSKSTI